MRQLGTTYLERPPTDDAPHRRFYALELSKDADSYRLRITHGGEGWDGRTETRHETHEEDAIWNRLQTLLDRRRRHGYRPVRHSGVCVSLWLKRRLDRSLTETIRTHRRSDDAT